MQLTETQPGFVTITYDSGDTNSIRTRHFRCPGNGGYVSEKQGPDWRRVGAALMPNGTTMYCEHPDNLPEMIRREFEKMRRLEQALSMKLVG